MNVQTINDNVRTFCFFILRATPWCWPPPAPYQRRRHLNCRSNRGHWAPTALLARVRPCAGPVATAAIPHVERRVHPPSVQHGGRCFPTYPSHDLRTPPNTLRLYMNTRVRENGCSCATVMRNSFEFQRSFDKVIQLNVSYTRIRLQIIFTKSRYTKKLKINSNTIFHCDFL